MDSTLDRIMAARVKVAYDFSYYSAALWRLELVPSTHAYLKGTMGVDKHFRLYYDPDLQWTVDQLEPILVHEINHVFRDHPRRADDIPGVDALLYNVAGDVALNQDIVNLPALKDKWPSPPLLPETFNCPHKNQTVEFYYEWLQEQADQNCTCSQGGQQGQGEGQGGDQANCPIHGHHECGSCAHGQERPWELGPPTDGNPGVGEAEANQIRRQVAEDIRAAYDDVSNKGRGTIAAGLLRAADEILSPRVPWQKVLPAQIRQARMTAMGRVDYTFSRPNKRVSVTGFIQPVLRAPDISLGITVDTSGSVTNRALGQTLAELKNVFRAYPNSWVYCVDAAVHTAQRLTSDPTKIKMLGAGGTDMMLGINHVASLRKHHVAVCITDAICPFDEKGPNIPTVLVVIDNPDAKTPPWARVVHISTDEAGIPKAA